MFDSTSIAEKVGIAGLVGGIVVAAVKTVRWIANFSEEHRLLMGHLAVATPMLTEFVKVKEASETAQRERGEIIEELRGLRRDINDVLKLMVQIRAGQ